MSSTDTRTRSSRSALVLLLAVVALAAGGFVGPASAAPRQRTAIPASTFQWPKRILLPSGRYFDRDRRTIVFGDALEDPDRGEHGPSLNRLRHGGLRRSLRARQRSRAGRPLLGDAAIDRLREVQRGREGTRILDSRGGHVPGRGRVGEDEEPSITTVGDDTAPEGSGGVIGSGRQPSQDTSDDLAVIGSGRQPSQDTSDDLAVIGGHSP